MTITIDYDNDEVCINRDDNKEVVVSFKGHTFDFMLRVGMLVDELLHALNHKGVVLQTQDNGETTPKAEW